MTIASLADLCEFLSADNPTMLNRRLYKATDCGASISVQTPDGVWHHNGRDWTGVTEIVAFTIQTIVEGSDATVDSDPFTLPVEGADVDRWINEMEAEASALWQDANNPMCLCGHRSEQHAWRDVPQPRIAGEVDCYECEQDGCDCQKFEEYEEVSYA